MFATWWTMETERSGVVHPKPYRDPEHEASIPYVPEESELNTTWEQVSSRITTTAQPKSKAYPVQRPYMAAVRRSPPSESSFGSRARMEQDVPEEILDEVQHLEERLAILRDRHGLPPRGATPPEDPNL